MTSPTDPARALAERAAVATAAAPDGASLRHELEGALEAACSELGLPWAPFPLERLADPDEPRRERLAGVAHGAVVVEYQPPGGFEARETSPALRRARRRAEASAHRLAREEGRLRGGHVAVVWDGRSISFGGSTPGGTPGAPGAADWSPLAPFDAHGAGRLLEHLARDGVPVVHPRLLSALAGPDSAPGRRLIPRFFEALRATGTGAPPDAGRAGRSRLLFAEWRRLFGRVSGVRSERLRELLERHGRTHGQPYERDPATYLFALDTYIALVAKLVAALALPGASDDVRDASVPVAERIAALESGRLFLDAGVADMLRADFFSWYADDPARGGFEPLVERVVARLAGIDFDVRKKSPDATRDLFKGLYQSFVPRPLRHALGEYYTPDWLAAHALDQVGWTPEDGLIDPTCGSGTFLLEALRRRLREAAPEAGAAELLQGIYGLDLNPLAVLTARASLVVFLSDRLRADRLRGAPPVRLPVFLADALHPATADGASYRHTVRTQRDALPVAVPRRVVESPDLLEIFGRLRELIDRGPDAEPDAPPDAPPDSGAVRRALEARFPLLAALDDRERGDLDATIRTLVELHARGWNGIWCAILAERFAAGAIPPSTHVCGNPPWVQWSNLPAEYAAQIKERCLELGVFGEDRWVGGIESDVSTVITHEAIDRWLADGGTLAFFITGTVFANESSQGFRRFRLGDPEVRAGVLRVEDFGAVAPFEGVRNHATLLTVQRGGETAYPVPYWIWEPPRDGRGVRRTFASGVEFRERARVEKLWAMPVPGSDEGPWLKGTRRQLALWSRIFGGSSGHAYRARKGVTTDRNGIFFVRVRGLDAEGELATIRNDPGLGRTRGITERTGPVEAEHLFPLLRGRGVRAFSAAPDPEVRLLLPQRGMHGDPDLPESAPATHRFLARFRAQLEARSSLRRYQRNQPYWSLWSTGPYTFAPYKVVWREMSGGRFAAALVGSHPDPVLGRKRVIPDHKLYFIPLDDRAEAAFVTGLLNAPVVSGAVSAYASQLSLGVSVVEYLDLPAFDPRSPLHRRVAALALRATRRGGATAGELAELDRCAGAVFGL